MDAHGQPTYKALPPRRPRRRFLLVLIPALLGLLLLGVAVGLFVVLAGDEDEAAGERAATTARTEAVGEGPWLWITHSGSNTVSRVDPETGGLVASIPVGKWPTDVAIGHGSVWVANAESDTVSRVDPATNQVVATIDTQEAAGVTVSSDAVWVARNSDPPSVVPVDPETNELGEPIELGEEQDPEGMVFLEGTLFAEETYSGGLLRIDTDTGEVEGIDFDEVVTDITALNGTIYVAESTAVRAVDPDTMEVTASYESDERPWALAADGNASAVWVAFQEPRAKRIDLAGGDYAPTLVEFESSSQPSAAVMAHGALWVVDEGGELSKIDPKTERIVKTVDIPKASGVAEMVLG